MLGGVEILEANGFDYGYGDVILKHSHSSYFQLYYIIRGSGVFLWNLDKMTLNTHDFLLIAPKQEHFMPPLKTMGCTILDIKFAIPDAKFNALITSISGVHHIDSSSLQNLFTLIWNEAFERDQNYNIIIRNLIESVFLSLTRPNAGTASDSQYLNLSPYIIQNNENEQFSSLSLCVQRTLRYIEGTILENTSFSLDNTAKVLGYNKIYMSRCFSNEIGISITQYRTLLRIDKAKELLRNTESDIANIGRHLSYDNVTSFIKIFKQYVGLTPMEYRKSNTGFGDHSIRYSFRYLNDTKDNSNIIEKETE